MGVIPRVPVTVALSVSLAPTTMVRDVTVPVKVGPAGGVTEKHCSVSELAVTIG